MNLVRRNSCPKLSHFPKYFTQRGKVGGGGQCQNACRSRKKESKQSEITWKQLEPVRSICKIEKRREIVRALWYEQCPKNSFIRLYTVKGLLVLVEKFSISKEFRLELHSGAEGHAHSCFMFIYIHTCNTLFLSRAHANVHMHTHTCIFSHTLSLSFSLSLSISLSHTHTNTRTYTTHTHIHTHPHTHMPFLVFFKKISPHILYWSLQVCVQLRFNRTWCPHILFHIYIFLYVEKHKFVHICIYILTYTYEYVVLT